MRSDFLAETQKLRALNTLFAEQGFLVRAMNESELKDAISKPAEQAGHPLDQATVSLLIEQTEDREGALPLLQFALSRIWEGLEQGVSPAVTLEKIGGVGGALAGEAERVYQDLPPGEKSIARHVFLGLVQLGEGTHDTRRRVSITNLVPHRNESTTVKQVIDKFSASSKRLITCSANEEGIEAAEVTHETLIRNWPRLIEWLDENRTLLKQQRRIEQAAEEWRSQNHQSGYLLQGLPLTEAKLFQNTHTDIFPLSKLAGKFIRTSIRHRKIIRFKTLSWLIIPALTIIGITEAYFRETTIQENRARLEQEGTYGESQALVRLVEGCAEQYRFQWLPTYWSERLFGNCRPVLQAPLRNAKTTRA